MKRQRVLPIALVALTAALSVPGWAQQLADLKVETTRLSDQVCMLSCRGGNLALLTGEEGSLLIDSEYAQLADKVLAAVREVRDVPIRYVINTHWHFDHVGGNEALQKAGALIIAHENVRERMSSEQVLKPLNRTVPPSPEAALPTLTFTDSMTFHFNGEEVYVLRVPPAHTDGDSIVYFRKADVLHMGDIVFNGMYPFIDVGCGGSIDGMIQGVERGLALANEKTRIIPGHGPLATAADLRAYRDMLKTVSERVHKLIDEGKSREEVIAAQPTKDFDAAYGGRTFEPDQWVGIVYDGLSAG